MIQTPEPKPLIGMTYVIGLALAALVLIATFGG